MKGNGDKPSFAKTLAKEGLKQGWKKLPIAIKLKIIGIGSIVVLILIIILAIIGSFNYNTVSYNDPSLSEEERKELDENWADMCSYGECDTKVLESQKKFYAQLDNMVTKYNLNNEQRYTIIATIFYEYEMDELLDGVAFELADEQSNQSGTSNPQDVYKEEKNSIKNLAKRFKSNESDNKSYYDYLENSNYFDNKNQLNSYFQEYANSKQKSVANLTEDERKVVRRLICSNIKDIVDDYMGTKKYTNVTVSSTGYWWPIGSSVTTIDNGKLFASGDPEFVYVSSYFGPRIHPKTGKQSYHGGIDIPGSANSANVIATLDGEVKEINNTCNSISTTDADNYCGGSFGNYIKIEDVKGNTNIYAHLYRDSLTVNVGDVVRQGQVIAKVGSSGMSTGPHLHFEIRINNNRVNPIDYVDPNNPRPMGSAEEFNFNTTVYSESEFVTIVNNYYSDDNVCSSYSADYTTRCNSLKDDILYGNGASIAYNVAKDNHINPELIFPRMMLEGYSPGVGHNYFGYACGNTYSGFSCLNGFVDFNSAMNAFFSFASNYTSLYDMMVDYAYLGKYWYADVSGGSSFGGCYYAKYIYPNGIPDRVQDACNQTTCTPSSDVGCVETTQEDLDAYTNWQVKRMTEVRKKIFK